MKESPEILLVDDEERFVEGLQGILSHYRYSCTSALTGGEALGLLREKQFDLALLDVGLPDMSGCDIAEFINDSCRDTTSIMLTGLNTVETAVLAMKKGAYDFLSKPINHEHLLKTLDKALEHNQLKQDLKTSEGRYQMLAEAAWEGIAIIQESVLVEVNAQFQTMFGWEWDGSTTVHVGDEMFVPESSADKGSRWYDNEQSESFERSAMRKDGTRFPVEIRCRPVTYLGKPAKVFVFRDITDRVRHEQERFVMQEKLAKANKLEALGLMAGSVAHDLNNILTAVVNYPDLLLAEMGPEDPHYEPVKKLQEAGQRAAAVVSDLVSVARGRKTRAPVVVLNEHIQNHLSSIEHTDRMSSYPGVVVDTGLAADLANCRCSTQHVHKILLNLVGNALEAIGHDGIIRITTENAMFENPVKVRPELSARGGNYIKMSIADNGTGIDPADLEHIFDPFYSTKAGGLGLGLPICRSVVEAHGGRLWIAEAAGPGATLAVELPGLEEKAP